MGRVLDLAASGAGQVAAEKRLKHENKRVLLASSELLAYDIARRGPHLRNRYWHEAEPLVLSYFSRLERRTGYTPIASFQVPFGFVKPPVLRKQTMWGNPDWWDGLQPASTLIRLKHVPFCVSTSAREACFQPGKPGTLC